MDVSIIIVNWNTRQILRNCLESVYEQTGGLSFEVIVIDNNSADGSCRMIRRYFPDVVLIKNCQNKGFAAANNQGIRIAKGRYVLFLNSDTLILDRAVTKIVSFADENPEAAIVGCRVLNPDRTPQSTSFMFPSIVNMMLSSSYLYKLLPESRFFGRERMRWCSNKRVKEVDVVTGCFMLARRQAIEKVGLMDEAFFMYGEETDWSWRFKEAGWKVLLAPVGEIIHFGQQSSRQNAGAMLLQLRGSILLFFKKHRGFQRYILACILTSLFFMLRIPIWIFIAIIPGEGQVDAWRRCVTYAKGAVLSLMGASRLCVRVKPGAE